MNSIRGCLREREKWRFLKAGKWEGNGSEIEVSGVMLVDDEIEEEMSKESDRHG